MRTNPSTVDVVACVNKVAMGTTDESARGAFVNSAIPIISTIANEFQLDI